MENKPAPTLHIAQGSLAEMRRLEAQLARLGIAARLTRPPGPAGG